MRADRPVTPLSPPPNALPELLEALQAAAARGGLELHSEPLRHRCGEYPLLRLASPDLHRYRQVMLVRAGIHGDEIAGPLTFARHLESLFEHARASDLRLVVYPLGNPSGYARGVRYNGDHDPGAEGNNDFLRYRLPDGRLAGGLPGTDTPFDGWLWSGDPSLAIPLPEETRVMQRMLAAEPLTRLAAVLDLHQDRLTPGVGPAAYHYAFGDLDRYSAIVERIAGHVPLLAGTAIGAGFGTRIDRHGAVLVPGDADEPPVSDARGFIVRHDGTLTDLAWRLGIGHAVAPETTAATPLDEAIAVNRIWVEGLIEVLCPPGSAT